MGICLGIINCFFEFVDFLDCLEICLLGAIFVVVIDFDFFMGCIIVYCGFVEKV